MVRLVFGVVAALTLVTGGGIATASHSTDTVYIHTGVSSEDEARAYPCPPAADARGWERSGPVVCLAKVADQWRLDYDIPNDRGCSYYSTTGWSGSCVFDLDMDDHIRVWGTSGIQMTTVTVDWGHADHDDQSDGGQDDDGSGQDDGADAEPDPDSGDDGGGGSSGPSGPSGPDQPQRPAQPQQPDPPRAPDNPDQPDQPSSGSGSDGASSSSSGTSGSSSASGSAPADADGTSMGAGSGSDAGSGGDVVTISQPADDPTADGGSGRGGALALAVLALAVAIGMLVRELELVGDTGRGAGGGRAN